MKIAHCRIYVVCQTSKMTSIYDAPASTLLKRIKANFFRFNVFFIWLIFRTYLFVVRVFICFNRVQTMFWCSQSCCLTLYLQLIWIGCVYFQTRKNPPFIYFFFVALHVLLIAIKGASFTYKTLSFKYKQRELHMPKNSTCNAPCDTNKSIRQKPDRNYNQ